MLAELSLGLVAVISLAVAAPGALNPYRGHTLISQDMEADPSNNLGPALSMVARRRRALSLGLANSPLKRGSSLSRYRYPVYRKRIPSEYLEENIEDPIAFLMDEERAEDDRFDFPSRRPNPISSSFRERNFDLDDIPVKKFLPTAVVPPLVKKTNEYDITKTPYDLEAVRKLYEMGKRTLKRNFEENDDKKRFDDKKKKKSDNEEEEEEFDNEKKKKKRDYDNERPFDFENYEQKKRNYGDDSFTLDDLDNREVEYFDPSYFQTSRASTFDDVIDALRKRTLKKKSFSKEDRKRTSPQFLEEFLAADRERQKEEIERQEALAEAEAEERYSELEELLEAAADEYLKEALEAEEMERGLLAAEEYYQEDPEGGIWRERPVEADITPYIRKKRSLNAQEEETEKKSESEKEEVEDNRKRRSANDKKKKSNDRLAREYFKAIARSVGQRRKRGEGMPRSETAGELLKGRLEVRRRRQDLEEVLDDPAMLKYMENKLKEAEQRVLEAADSSTGSTLTTDLSRLDALERLEEAVHRLRLLQLQTQEKKKKRSESNEDADEDEESESEEKDKKGQIEVPLAQSLDPSSKNNQVDEDKRRKKKSDEDSKKKRILEENVGEEDKKRKRKKKLADIFGPEIETECPVAAGLVGNCEMVSQSAGDEDLVFLPACAIHELCYMCGGAVGAGPADCDALLSSSAESTCGVNGACLRSAAIVFQMLTDRARYDETALCPIDPCIQSFLPVR